MTETPWLKGGIKRYNDGSTQPYEFRWTTRELPKDPCNTCKGTSIDNFQDPCDQCGGTGLEDGLAPPRLIREIEVRLLKRVYPPIEPEKRSVLDHVR